MDDVQTAEAELAAAQEHLAQAEAAHEAEVAAPAAPEPTPPPATEPETTDEVEAPEAVAARRQEDGTARPDGRQPTTIPDPEE